MKTFGRYVKDKIARLGKSQKDLAAELGVSPAYISQIFTGKKKPSGSRKTEESISAKNLVPIPGSIGRRYSGSCPIRTSSSSPTAQSKVSQYAGPSPATRQQYRDGIR